MIRSLTVDWSPAYELVLSLAVFVDRQRWKTIDLGSAWGSNVEKRLSPDALALVRPIKDPRALHHLFPLIRKSPSGGAEGFLCWLAGLTPGELYGCMHPHVEEIAPHLPWDLVTWRDRLVEALSVWHERYFRHVDPVILAHLQAEVNARRAQAACSPAQEVVLEATNGVNLAEDEVAEVLLVPQYHMSPWNVGSALTGLRILLYPVDMSQANPDDPPLALLRLTRALADENRLRILRLLGKGSLTLSELTDRTRLAKSTVHHHMVALRAARLVLIHEVGKEARYSLNPTGVDQLSDQFRSFVLPKTEEV